MMDADFTKEDLKALADFWPVFANPNFVWEKETPAESKEKDVFVMPNRIWDREAHAFHKMIYKQGWVVDFDWTEWVQTKEAKDFFSDLNKIENATPLQLAKIITALARRERFNEGTLAEATDTGMLERITKRAASLM